MSTAGTGTSTNSSLVVTDAPHWNTAKHHGPAVSVVTWLLIIGVVLAVAARLMTRYAIIKTLRWDDITALLSTIAAIGQSIAVSYEAANGLGSQGNSLSATQRDIFQKSDYASGLLYIATLGLIKVSICIHIHGLTPIRSQRLASIGVGCFTALWAVSSFFVIAFRCTPPRPWAITESKCIDFLAFWTYFDILNILTDIALIALPIPIITKLQVSSGKKAVVLGCYATRIFVVAAVVVQIYYLQTKTGKSNDLTYDLWIPVLCAQVVAAFSIITACFPFLKFLVDALETGLVRAADGRKARTQKYGSSSDNAGGAYIKAQDSRFRQGPSYGVASSGDLTASKLPSRVHHSDVLRMDNLNKNGATAGGRREGNPDHMQTTAMKGSRTSDDVDSQSSQTHIIKKVEWTLTEENSGVPGVVTP
ncbi:hypothetical protein ACLMJK_001460 [Lecanora helva]